MNLILLEAKADEIEWPAADPRAVHVRETLRMAPGDAFYVGVENGPRGMARIVADDDAMRLEIEWRETPSPPFPLTLLAGLPRPQTARKLLQECTAIGYGRIWFFNSEKGEPSYASSKLWTTDEWKRHLRQGVEQAFSTWLPETRRFNSLADAIDSLEPEGSRIALDLYEATAALAEMQPQAPVSLAIGPERGWSGAERDLLRSSGFVIASMGERVLREETAAVAGCATLAARMGWK